MREVQFEFVRVLHLNIGLRHNFLILFRDDNLHFHSITQDECLSWNLVSAQ